MQEGNGNVPAVSKYAKKDIRRRTRWSADRYVHLGADTSFVKLKESRKTSSSSSFYSRDCLAFPFLPRISPADSESG